MLQMERWQCDVHSILLSTCLVRLSYALMEIFYLCVLLWCVPFSHDHFQPSNLSSSFFPPSEPLKWTVLGLFKENLLFVFFRNPFFPFRLCLLRRAFTSSPFLSSFYCHFWMFFFVVCFDFEKIIIVFFAGSRGRSHVFFWWLVKKGKKLKYLEDPLFLSWNGWFHGWFHFYCREFQLL